MDAINSLKPEYPVFCAKDLLISWYGHAVTFDYSNEFLMFLRSYHRANLTSSLQFLLLLNRYIQGDSGGNSIFWEMILWIILRKISSYEHVCKCEWLPR